MKFSSSITIAAALLHRQSEAFSSFSSSTFGLRSSSLSSSAVTTLYGRKKGLAGRVDGGGVSTKKKKKKANKNNNNKNKAKDETAKVSSSLSAWAASLDDNSSEIGGGGSGSVATTATAAATDSSSTFERFDQSSSSSSSSSKKLTRRERSTSRQEKDASKKRRIDAILTSITTRIESKNLSIDALLSDISTLVQMQPLSGMTLKALMNNKTINNYSLAWVGADEAICHVGTGLHKVPLARLQDVFFSIGRDPNSGKPKSVTLLEVIRILGPFPNVRNTLQGSVVDAKSVDTDFKGVDITENKIRIKYDSMMDGLGKEINAGTEGNVRYVNLNLLYADEKALVCVVPKEEGDDNEDDNDDDEFGENGKNVLLFLKEDDLDLKLEELRAA